jgi:hypothetical protein
MKYRSLHIIALLFAFFISSSESCDSTAEEEQRRKKERLHQKIEIIKDGFESDYLTETAKIAYEEKAKQKLVDFSDYFTVYSDKSLDTLFRKITGNMMLNLFDKDATILEFKLDDGENRCRMNNIEELLERLLHSEYDVLQLKTDTIQTYKALERINETTYVGILSYTQSVKGIMGNDTTLVDEITMRSDFYVRKVTKNIGMESKRIWKVFLGNLERY